MVMEEIKKYVIGDTEISIKIDIYDSEDIGTANFAVSDALAIHKVVADIYPYNINNGSNNRYVDMDENILSTAMEHVVDDLLKKNVKCILFDACVSNSYIKNKYGKDADDFFESLKIDELMDDVEKLIQRECRIAEAAGLVNVNDKFGNYEYSVEYGFIKE